MLHYFTNNIKNIQLHENPHLINEFQYLPLFENSNLYIYNPIIDKGEVETLIIREDMQLYGKVYLKSIYKSIFNMSDSIKEQDTFTNSREYTYIYIEGIFDTYISNLFHKKFYINED